METKNEKLVDRIFASLYVVLIISGIYITKLVLETLAGAR